MAEFIYKDPFPLAKDVARYRLLAKDFVSVSTFDGEEILKIEPDALRILAREAMRDASFLLRTSHLEQTAAIVEATCKEAAITGFYAINIAAALVAFLGLLIALKWMKKKRKEA